MVGQLQMEEWFKTIVMIQKRYKQTAKLAQAQGLKQMLETLPVILAEISLPEITVMPNHSQVLRVRDINVAICADYVGLTPRRILVDKESGEEIDLNLFVPKWEITGSSVSSHVTAEGEREYYEMEWYNDETNEAITSEILNQVGENGQTFLEANQLEELVDEVFLMPSIPYLMFFTQQIKLPLLIQMFSAQFVSDNVDIWTKLK